jgi:hypothetical protein
LHILLSQHLCVSVSFSRFTNLFLLFSLLPSFFPSHHTHSVSLLLSSSLSPLE